MQYKIFIILSLCLSCCANLIYLAIVYPGLEEVRGTNSNWKLSELKEFLNEFYIGNKPDLLRNVALADFYVKHGGLLYYFFFVLISTYSFHIINNNFYKTALFSLVAIFSYKLVVSILKDASKIVSESRIILAILFLTSIILNALIICYLTIYLIRYIY